MRLPLILAATALLSTAAAAQQVSDSNAFLNAVRDKDGAMATRLLESGGSTVLSARNGEGDTALHIAIRRRDAGWLGFLLARGADPNLPSRQGEPPIVLAGQLGFLDGVNLLLREGARVDATNRRGETALIAAVQSANLPGSRGALPLVQRLLRAGANPNKTDASAGYSAIDYARQDRRSTAILRALEEKKPAAATPVIGPAAPAASITSPAGTGPRFIGGGLQTLVRPADYPTAAAMARQQGSVAVRLDINAQGRVQGCTVTQSSGSAILDVSTCRIIRSRARYTPARDPAGNAVSGTIDGRLTWRLAG